MSQINRFLSLTKPGIVVGNLITVSGAFLLASAGTLHFLLLLETLLGIALVMASGCVFNNYIDRDIDGLMERTKYRLTAQGLISTKTVIAFAILLGILGPLVLYVTTNVLTTLIALFGLFAYVVLYSLWFKRHSIFGTVVGSISGAIPPVVGYCAVTNQLNAGAIVLFLILVCWQMPHSFAIAIYRLKDYTAAGIPVLPVKKGLWFTKMSMLVYVIVFAAAAIMPTLLGYTGTAYLIAAIGIDLYWLYLCMKGFLTKNDRMWARQMFGFSIISIMVLSVMMSFGSSI